MIKRWLEYLAVWALCLVFYLANRQWMGWMVFFSITVLPIFSLLVSLPAMLLSRLELTLPECVRAGEKVTLDLGLECPLPQPAWRVRCTVRHSLTGEAIRLQPGNLLPTEHCGALQLQLTRGRVYDYLGLFFLPRKAPGLLWLPIRPQPEKTKQLPDLQLQNATQWRPKAGGGFAENHELRLYRPGDSLRQIHWKLSGKTGKLIYREPMESTASRLQLRLVHSGTVAQLERKLGRLLWLGSWLLARSIPFDVQADTPDGPLLWQGNTEECFLSGLDTLLRCPPLEDDTPLRVGHRWQFYIGGDADEA